MRKTIALLTGGYGAERSVSLKSSKNVEQHLDKDRFDVYCIDVNRERWWHEDSQQSIDRNDFSLMIDGKKVQFDAAFIMIHGDPAENGLIQGYFQSLNIPFTTCSTFVSALTFNKFFCNRILGEYGIISAKSKLLRKGEAWENRRIQELGFPLFVKPNNNGSSYGITKVKHESELEEAIEKGFKYDDELIVEEFVPGREFTCGAIRLQGQIHTFPITEIISYNEFFDFEAKYENASDEITPADLPADEVETCQTITRRIYESLGCHGIVRVDFILKDKLFYVIEVNTIPGMTEQSLVPQQIRAYGWTESELFNRLLDEVME